MRGGIILVPNVLTAVSAVFLVAEVEVVDSIFDSIDSVDTEPLLDTWVPDLLGLPPELLRELTIPALVVLAVLLVPGYTTATLSRTLLLCRDSTSNMNFCTSL